MSATCLVCGTPTGYDPILVIGRPIWFCSVCAPQIVEGLAQGGELLPDCDDCGCPQHLQCTCVDPERHTHHA